MKLAKGHGTGNDFVLVPDLDGTVHLDGTTVRALCNRRTGVGGDGVLRIVPSAAVDEAPPGAAWFMDYRNADGSFAEMCGNGIRVYVRWLQLHGHIGPGPLDVATRAGLRRVHVPADVHTEISVVMGRPRIGGRRRVRAGVVDAEGIEIDMGNPHVVVAVDDPAAAGPLLAAPEVDADSPVNVEFVATVGPGWLRMRVHERGSGETSSCGTGACAAAAALGGYQVGQAGEVAVEVPGGALTVSWDETGLLTLTGPAVVVGEVVPDDDWVAAYAPSLAVAVSA